MTMHPSQTPSPATNRWNVRHRPLRAALPPLTERVQLSWLSPDTGEVEEAVRAIPAMRLFTQAFGAFARGGLVPTPGGPVAVEDLIPGDRVVTTEGPMALLWKGARTLARPRSGGASVYRIPADALGLGRPMPDLMLGPSARIASRRTDSGPTFVPVSSMPDSMAVIAITPISPVQTFHLAFARHLSFTINGVEVESHHPGRIDAHVGQETQELYLSLFPHLRGMGDFGPLRLPRASDAGDAQNGAA